MKEYVGRWFDSGIEQRISFVQQIQDAIYAHSCQEPANGSSHTFERAKPVQSQDLRYHERAKVAFDRDDTPPQEAIDISGYSSLSPSDNRCLRSRGKGLPRRAEREIRVQVNVALSVVVQTLSSAQCNFIGDTDRVLGPVLILGARSGCSLFQTCAGTWSQPTYRWPQTAAERYSDGPGPGNRLRVRTRHLRVGAI